MKIIRCSALWGAVSLGVVALIWLYFAALRAGYGEGIESGPVGESLIIVTAIMTGLAALIGAGVGAVIGLVLYLFKRSKKQTMLVDPDESAWPPPPERSVRPPG